jgi:hypothetical protein
MKQIIKHRNSIKLNLKRFYFGLVILLLAFICIEHQESYGQTGHVGKHNRPEDILAKLLDGEDITKFQAVTSGNRFTLETVHIDSRLNDVRIHANQELIIASELPYDFSTILIEGTLKIYSNNKSVLKAQKIIIAPYGKLIIGNYNDPIYNDVEIIFKKTQPGEMGIFVLGELVIYGREVEPVFVELINDAKKGDNLLITKKLFKNWVEGDKIVVTSSGFNYGEECGTEEAEIFSVSKFTIQLNKPLRCDHKATYYQDGNLDTSQSHVSILSRKVLIKSEDKNVRGSINFFYGSKGVIKYAQLEDLGPQNTLGRYPIHVHLLDDGGKNIQIVGNAIVNSDNRWIVIHGSNGVLVKNNVGYKSIGHGYFLEDGSEIENVFDNNIGIFIKRGGNLTESDGRASVFWAENPYNSFSNNVAVGGYYYGYYFVIPDKLIELSNLHQVNLQTLPLLQFDNNQAYNNRHSGVTILRINENESHILPSFVLSNSTIWNVGSKTSDEIDSGILIDSNNIIINNTKIFDSSTGITLRGNNNTIFKTILLNNYVEKNNVAHSGIVIAGKDNQIKYSSVKGYQSDDDSLVSDISLSNKVDSQISAIISDTELSDEKPIIFGLPKHLDSFLLVYGFNTYDKTSEINRPEDFVLRRLDYKASELIENSFVDTNFMAQLEPLNQSLIPTDSENRIANSNINRSKYTSENFKKMAVLWSGNKISDDAFQNEIRSLLKHKIIASENFNASYDFSDLNTPKWLKNLIIYWNDDLITDVEFFRALKFITGL